MSLSVSHLEKIQESKEIPTVLREIVSIFLAAINDWPNQIDSLVDYEKELYKLMGEKVDRNKLEEYVSKIDYSKFAWEAESLSQLIQVYTYYQDYIPLKNILNEVKEKIQVVVVGKI